MNSEYLVVGHFRNVDETRSAIRELRSAGASDLELYTAFPNHDLEEEMFVGVKRSPVRRVTLLGALLGLSGAFLMTIWMSVDYPIRVSAKPLISIPAFVVIAFECTVLIGCISNLLAMFHFSRIPWPFRVPGFRPAFSEGTFGLTVRAPKEKTDAIKQSMERLGAHHVEVQYVR